MKIILSVIAALVLAGCAVAQPGFYRTDTSPAIRWGRQDTNKIVEHYVAASGEPTISSNVNMAFTSSLALANDRYWLTKDTVGTNIQAFGMNASNHIVFGTMAAPTGADSGDVLFYRRNVLAFKITGSGLLPPWIEPESTSTNIGISTKPFGSIYALNLHAMGTASSTGSLYLSGYNNVGAVVLSASSDVAGSAGYVVRFPKDAPTGTGQVLSVASISGFDYNMQWGSGGTSYPLDHTGVGVVNHYLSTDGQEVNLTLRAYSSAATTDRGGVFVGRTRGTVASPSDVAVGDRLGTFAATGWAGGGFYTGARLNFIVESISGTNVGAAIDFSTRNAAGTLADRWRISGEGHLYPNTDNALTFGGSSNRPSTAYLRTVNLTNDTPIQMRDTAGTAINVLKMTGTNYLEIGTMAAPTGASSGDVLFYRRGTLWAKITGSNVLEPETAGSAAIGSLSKPFSIVDSRLLRGHGSSSATGSLELGGFNDVGTIVIRPSQDAGGFSNYVLHLPKDAPTATGQTLTVSAISAPYYDLQWSASGGASYPLNHTGAAGSAVLHLLNTESQDLTLGLTAYSGIAASDRAGLTMRRARGTEASPTNIAANDRLGIFGTFGLVGGAFRLSTLLNIYADSVDTVNNRAPGRWEFGTTNAAGTTAARWILDAEGHWRPGTNNAWTLGAASFRPSTMYTTNLDVSNLVMSSLVPNGSGTYTLGGVSNYWGAVYTTGLNLAGGVSFASTYDVGASGARAGTVYTTNLNISGTCTGCPGGSVPWTAVPSSIIPSAHQTYDLGSGTEWNHVYSKYGNFSDAIVVGSALNAGNNSGSPIVQIGSLLGGSAQLYFNSGSTVQAPNGSAGSSTSVSCANINLTVSAGIVTAISCY